MASSSRGAFQIITNWLEANTIMCTEALIGILMEKSENWKSTAVSMVWRFFCPLNHPACVSLTPPRLLSFSVIKLSSPFLSPPSAAQQAAPSSVSLISFCFFLRLFPCSLFFFYLTFRPHIYASVGPSVRLTIYLSVYLFGCLLSVRLSVYRSVRLSIHPSIHQLFYTCSPSTVQCN